MKCKKSILTNKYIGITIAIPTVFFIWYILALYMDTKIVPNPFSVLKEIPTILKDEETFSYIRYSVQRVFVSIGVAVALGTFIGTSMAFNKTIDKILSPIIYLTYPIPKLALLPIVIILFGLGELSKIIMIVAILIFQVITAIRGAVINVPKSNYVYFKILGINKVKTFFHIVAPTILKQLFVTLKIATGTAISVLFFTETYGTKNGGLGYYIMDSFSSVNYINMYGGILILSFIGFFIFITLDILENILTPWEE